MGTIRAAESCGKLNQSSEPVESFFGDSRTEQLLRNFGIKRYVIRSAVRGSRQTVLWYSKSCWRYSDKIIFLLLAQHNFGRNDVKKKEDRQHVSRVFKGRYIYSGTTHNWQVFIYQFGYELTKLTMLGLNLISKLFYNRCSFMSNRSLY